MTREANLWASFKEALPSDAHAVRIENQVEVGTPDVNLCFNGFDGWVELKVQEAPKRATTTFRCEHFTMEQRLWLVDRCRAGGRAYLLLQSGSHYLWLRGDVAAVWVGQCTLSDLHGKSEWVGEHLSELVDHLRV